MLRSIPTYLLFLFLAIRPIEALIWSEPVNISNTTSTDPEIALDSFGNAIAVWQSQDIATHSFTVYASKLAAGTSTWSSPVQLSTLGVDSYSPVIAMNASGYAVVAWLSQIGSILRVQAVTGSFSGSWSSPFNISGSQPVIGSANPLAIDMDSTGNTMILWPYAINYPSSSSAVIQAGYLPYLGSLSTTTLSSSLLNSAFPSVDLAPSSGKGVAAWTAYGTGYALTQVATFSSGSWSTVYTLTSTFDNNYTPKAVIDSLGNSTVAWINSTSALLFAQLASGSTTWSSTVTLDTSTGNNVALAVESSNTVVMIWNHLGNGANSTMRATTIPWGQSYTPIATISSPNENAYDNFALAIGPLNTAYATWITDPSTSNTNYVKIATLPAGGYWIPAYTISDNRSGSIDSVGIATGGPNQAGIVWTLYTSEASSVIQATTSVSILPPYGIQGDTTVHRFPIQSDVINQLSWISPHTYGVYGYRVYRGSLSNLIGTTTVPYFEDHDRLIGQPDTYFVSTINGGGEESTPITITITP